MRKKRAGTRPVCHGCRVGASVLVGMLSDGLAPLHGNEALRWALTYSMAAYVVGILSLAAAIGPYIKERSDLSAVLSQ